MYRFANSGAVSKKMRQSPKTNELVTDIQVPEGSFMLTSEEDSEMVPVYIDPFLTSQMRIHQKEGVKFMFECLSGKRGREVSGCILADSMGLGKTLQTIALIWTLLKKSILFIIYKNI